MAKNKLGRKIIAGLVATTIVAGAGVAGGMAIQNAYGDPNAGDNTQTEAPGVDYEKLELQEKLAEVQAKLTEAQTLLESKTAAFNELKETTDSEIATLNNQIAEKDAAIETANAELEQAVTDLAAAQQTVESLTVEKETLQTSYDLKVAELETAETDLATAQANVATLTQQKSDLENQLATETENKEAVQAELNNVNAQLETANADFAAAQSAIETKNAELETLQASYDSKVAELETAQNNVSTLTTQVETLTTEKTQLEADKQTLANEKATLQEQLENAEAEVVILNARIVELENALNSGDPDRTNLIKILGATDIYKTKLDDGGLLIGLGKTTGIYYIDSLTYSTTCLDSEHSYNAFKKLSNGNIICGYTGNFQTGLRVFNEDNKNLSVLIESYSADSTDFGAIKELKDGSLLFIKDAYRLDINTGNITNITKFEDQIMMQVVRQTLSLSNGDILIIESANGLFVFNESKNEYKLINKSVKDYDAKIFLINNEKFMAITSTTFYIYDSSSYDELFKKSGLDVTYYHVSNDLMFINGYSYGVKMINLYDYTITDLDSRQGYYSTFIEDENGVYIVRDASYGSGSVYYNFNTTEIITLESNQQLVKFIVGDNVYYSIVQINAVIGDAFSAATGINDTNYIFRLNDYKDLEYSEKLSDFNNRIINIVVCNEIQTISYIVDNDGVWDTVATQECIVGDTVVPPVNPVKDGYIFIGWVDYNKFIDTDTLTEEDLSESLIDFSTYKMGSDDLMLVALFAENYNGTFTGYLGEEEYSLIIEDGKIVSLGNNNFTWNISEGDKIIDESTSENGYYLYYANESVVNPAGETTSLYIGLYLNQESDYTYTAEWVVGDDNIEAVFSR